MCPFMNSRLLYLLIILRLSRFGLIVSNSSRNEPDQSIVTPFALFGLQTDWSDANTDCEGKLPTSGVLRFSTQLLFFHLLITTHDNHIMPTINDHCADEVKPGKKCANCHSICYCSTDCQRADWKTHKMLCAAFEGVRHPSAPGMTRLLMFTTRIRYDPNKGLPDPLFCRMPVKLGPVHHPVAGLPFGTDVMLLAVSLSFAQHQRLAQSCLTESPYNIATTST